MKLEPAGGLNFSRWFDSSCDIQEKISIPVLLLHGDRNALISKIKSRRDGSQKLSVNIFNLVDYIREEHWKMRQLHVATVKTAQLTQRWHARES